MSKRVGNDGTVHESSGVAMLNHKTAPDVHKPAAPAAVLGSHSTEPGVTGAQVPVHGTLGGEP
jgi:hypothetical protein